MPLMKHKVLELSKEITNNVLDGDIVGVNREKVKYHITEYFKDKIVVIWGPGDIESIASDMDLRLADDEIEEIVAQVQNDHDGNRGISWQNIGSEVEKYLEYTQRGERQNAPDFYVVRVDETGAWDKEFLTQHKIKTMYSVFLVDRNQVTHLCEAASSYCCYWLSNSWEMEDGVETPEDFDVVVREASCYEEPVTYFHCPVVDDLNGTGLSQFWSPDRLETTMYENEDAYDQLVEEMKQRYSENPVW
jgi:hypothetical protein